MKKGDYVLYDEIIWRVLRKHAEGTYQIKSLEPLKTWVNNTEVKPKDVTVVTKEVADILIAVNN